MIRRVDQTIVLKAIFDEIFPKLVPNSFFLGFLMFAFLQSSYLGCIILLILTAKWYKSDIAFPASSNAYEMSHMLDERTL